MELSEAEPLKLTILHTNDVHSRFLQTSKYSGTCSDEDSAKNACYGGFPRLHYKVNLKLHQMYQKNRGLNIFQDIWEPL